MLIIRIWQINQTPPSLPAFFFPFWPGTGSKLSWPFLINMASDASWALNRSTTSCKATSVIRSQLRTSTSVCQRRRGKVSIIRDKGSHKSSQDNLTMSQKHTHTGHLSSKLFHSGIIGKINRVVLVELFWGRVWKSYLPFVLSLRHLWNPGL